MRPSPAALAPVPTPPKIYTSEARFLSDLERENLEKKQKALQEEAKRKRNAERRQKDFPLIALKHRNKLLEEAAKGGWTYSEEELKRRVDCHMKKLEVIPIAHS
jgi:hypothetical protein